MRCSRPAAARRSTASWLIPRATSCHAATTPCWRSASAAISRSCDCDLPRYSRLLSNGSNGIAVKSLWGRGFHPVRRGRHYGRMPLTLVLGPANSAKAGEVLGAFAAAANRGAILVVPTSADAAHYGRELAESGAVLGSVLTFSGLAGEIANRAGYTGRRLTRLQ